MAKYKTIAVIYGSDSSEWEVACRSGEFVASRIDGDKFDVYEIFARFGRWQLVACKKKDAMRVTFPEGARPEMDKTDFILDDGTAEKRVILSGIHEFYEPEQLIGKTCIAITNLPPRKMMGIDSCGMLISAVHKEGDEERLHLLMVDPAIPAGAKLY